MADEADEQAGRPDSTAERTALWRALHVRVDAPPHLIEDEVGLRLIDPPAGWEERPDMDPESTAMFRAGIVARARVIEDLVAERAEHGVDQYVLLGAGLDTFAERRPELASRLTVFEVDQAGPQEWKRGRLVELGHGVPEWLRLVPADFEAGTWWQDLAAAGFDAGRPAVVASAGVSLYLTREANAETLRTLAAGLAPGSTVAMTFIVPPEELSGSDLEGLEHSRRGARSSGTPFRSFYTPQEITALARESGFTEVRHVSSAEVNERYFAGRSDGLRATHGEEMLLAGV